MKNLRLVVQATFLLICFSFISANVEAQKTSAKTKLGKICGNPQNKCRTNDDFFQEYEIPFEIPTNSNVVIVESEPFYAVVLKTVAANSEINCESAISETERIEIQDLFPANKVFALKCSDAGNLYYTNIAGDVNFIAVYAGKTLTEAKKFLETIKATGKFKGANIRRTRAGFNGT